MISVSFFSTSAGSASQPGAFPYLARRTASLTSSNEMMSSKPVSTGRGSVGVKFWFLYYIPIIVIK